MTAIPRDFTIYDLEAVQTSTTLVSVRLAVSTDSRELQPGSEALRVLFPVTDRYAYLNHASASPLNRRTADAVRQWTTDWETGGTQATFSEDILSDYRVRTARLIGARPDEIAFTRNTSDGLLLVALGLPWQPGDVLVTAETEFTANVYPWQSLLDRGVEIRRVPARDGRIHVDDVAAVMDERTRLLTLSFVEFHTGFRNRLAELGGLCRERGVWFCVDAIQGAGALPIDVDDMGIDFLSAGGAKWLLGPIGAGIFYCRRDLIDELDPKAYSWRSTVDPDDHFNYDLPLSDSATRFEAGTLTWPSLVGLMESIALLQDVGVGNIEKHVLALTDGLISSLADRGYELITPIGSRAERSGIVTFRHPEHPSSDLYEHLIAESIVVSQRGDDIRVSPHLYNTWDDIEHLLEALPQ